MPTCQGSRAKPETQGARILRAKDGRSTKGSQRAGEEFRPHEGLPHRGWLSAQAGLGEFLDEEVAADAGSET